MTEPTTKAGQALAMATHDAMHGEWCGRDDDEGEGRGYPADAGFAIDPILAIEAEAVAAYAATGGGQDREREHREKGIGWWRCIPVTLAPTPEPSAEAHRPTGPFEDGSPPVCVVDDETWPCSATPEPSAETRYNILGERQDPEPTAEADAAQRLNEFIAAQPSSHAKTQALIDLNAMLVREQAALSPATPPLDVERLARATCRAYHWRAEVPCDLHRAGHADRIAREYAALAIPTPEREP